MHTDGNQWHGIIHTYNMIEIEQDMQEMLTHVIKPPAGSNTIGFKEVCFEREDFHFIRMLFLCAKFLLSIREDVSKQARSAFHRKFNTTEQEASLKMKMSCWYLCREATPTTCIW
jgi:hypothetical protein